mgnify:CR=1 FL=1
MSAILTGSVVDSADVTAVSGLLESTLGALVKVAFSMINTMVSVFTDNGVIGYVVLLAIIGFISGFLYKKLVRRV